MKVFVATSYSSKVNYDTGEVFPEYKQWLENILTMLEQAGHEPFCALRADQYKINDEDPAKAFFLDMEHIQASDVILVLLDDHVSAGVQVEIGVGVALKKNVILAHLPEHKPAYFNAAMVQSGTVKEVLLPFDSQTLQGLLDTAAMTR